MSVTIQKTERQLLQEDTSSIYDEDGLIWEVVQGLVHEFPLCCIKEYCNDTWVLKKRPAERGVAVFRAFSLSHSRLLDIDRIGVPDVFVPCSKCASRLGARVRRLV